MLLSSANIKLNLKIINSHNDMNKILTSLLQIKKILFPLIFLFFTVQLFFTNVANAQVDTEFWFAVPNVCNNHSQADDVQDLRLASFNTVPVTVIVDIPANQSFAARTIVIPAGGTSLQTFNKADVEIPTNNTGSNTGLRIRSTLPITAYYEIGTGRNNNELFSLKGTNALGTRFYVPFQTTFDIDSRFYPEAQSSFNIIATQNNTRVTITLPSGKSAAGWGTGETERTITLNIGQTYSVASSSPLGSERLAGARVVSDKPIAITTNDDSILINSGADLTGDQIVPVNIIGNEYLIPPGRLNYTDGSRGITGSNNLFVVAAENNTSLYINGSLVVSGLNAGQTFRYTMPNPSASDANDSRFLKATDGSSLNGPAKPVYALYLSGFGEEAGSPLLPTIRCTGSKAVSFVRSSTSNFFLTILAQDEAIGNFTYELGGTVQAALNNPSNYFDNPSFPGWRVFQLEFSSEAAVPTGTALSLSNSRGYFHLGVINGQFSGGSARFGYFSDYGLIDTELPASLSVCPNTSLTLDPRLFGTITSTIWRRNGQQMDPNLYNRVTGVITFPVSPQSNLNVPDVYTVEIEDNRACRINDNVNITVFSEPDFNLNVKNNGSICNNDNTALITINPVACNGCSYQWARAGNNFTPSNAPLSHLPTTGGLYTVTATDANSCRNTEQVTITYNIAVTGTFNKPNAPVCTNNIPEFIAVARPPASSNYVFSSYSWKFNGTEIGQQSRYQAQANNGLYRLDLVDQNGCISSDEVNLSFVNPVTFDLGDKPTVCSAENFNIVVTTNPSNASLNSLQWFRNGTQFLSGVGNRTFRPTADGEYRVNIVDNNNCAFSDAINISKFSTTVPVVLIDPVGVVCSNANYQLSHATPSVTPNFKSYEWRFNGNVVGTNSSFTPTTSGTYTLNVIDNNDCPSSDNTNVNWVIAQTFNLGPDQNAPICTNGNFLITLPNNFSSPIWRLNSNTIIPSSGNGGRIHKPLLGQSGTFEVSAKDPNGCDASDQLFIGSVVDPTPISLSQPPNNVCSNAGFVINANPNNFPTYTWLFGNNPAPNASNSSSYTPRASGSYRVNAIDLNGCNTTASVNVNYVDTLPLNLNTPPSVFCANNTTYRITPSGGSFSSYVFSRNNQTINPISGPGISHRPSQSGRYLVAATDASGCTSRRFVDINYQDTADFSLPQLPTVVCENANGLNTTTIINAGSGFNSYTWALNGNPISPNISQSQHRPTIRGTYRVTITDANNCPATATVFANYFVPLSMRLTSSPAGTIACWNTNYTLTPTTGFVEYNWVATTSPALTIPVNTFSYKPLQSGKYKVIGTDPNTCKSADSITITYVPSFNLDLGNTKSTCQNIAFTINATKPNIVSYVWANSLGLPNPGTNQPTFNVTNPGFYSVRLTDNNGCIDQDTLDFRVVTELPLELGNDRIACSYEDFEVDATPNYNTYVWTNTAGLPNPSTNVSKFPVTASGKYKVTVTDVSGLCIASDSVNITYVPDLGFELNNPFSDTICFNDLYPNRFILARDSIKFDLVNYNWTWPVIPNGAIAPGAVVKVQPNVSGRYVATVQNKTNLCFDSDTSDIAFSRLLADFDLGAPNRVVCVDLEDSITSTLPEYRGSQFVWNWLVVPTGAVNPTPNTIAYPDRTGKYLAQLTDRFNCKAKDSVFIQFSDSLLDFNLGDPDEKICIATAADGKIIKATNPKYDNISNYTWAWTVPSGQTNPGNQSQIKPINSGTYTVRITDRWGCDTTDSKNISYFDDLFGFNIKSPDDTICFNTPIGDRTIKADSVKFNNLNIYEWTWTLPPNSKFRPLDSSAVVVDTSGEYFAKIVNKITQCENIDSTTVLFSDSLLALSFNKPFDTICFNEPLNLQEITSTDLKYHNLSNYTWTWTIPSNENIGNVFKVLPDRGGLYSAVVKDIYNCEAIASTQVTFDKSLQDLNLGPDSITVCFNIERKLTDSRYQGNEFKWEWTVPDFSRITNLTVNEISPDTTGKFKAMVTNLFKCSNRDSVQVQYSDSLRAFRLFKPADTICYNSIDLQRIVSTDQKKYHNLAEYTWTWTVPDGANNPGNDYKAIPNKTGVYTAFIRDRWDCPADDKTQVTFSEDLSGFDLGKPEDTICFNLPKTITSTLPVFQTNVYTWNWEIFPAGSIDPAGAKQFEPKTSGKYLVRIFNRELCDNLDSVAVTFSDSLAGFSLGDLNDTVCATRPSDTLRATDSRYNNLSNYTWKWDVPNGQPNVGNNFKIFPRVSGPYTAIVEDVWTCKVSRTKNVTYGDSININLDKNDTIACAGTNFVIDAGPGFVKYEWNVKDYKEQVYIPFLSGFYKVTVTDRLGCTGSDSLNVTYVPIPLVELPRNLRVCSNADAPKIVAKKGFDTYKWNDNLPTKDNVFLLTFPSFQGNSKVETVSLTVTSLICKADFTTEVTYIQKNDGNLGNDTTVCLDQPVVIDAGRGFDSYFWYSQCTGNEIIGRGQTFKATKPCFYFVDLTSECGISTPGTNVFNFDSIRTNFIPDSVLCIGEKLIIRDLMDLNKPIKDKYTYTWFEKNSLTFISDTVGNIEVEREGNYQVMIKDKYNCMLRDSIQVTMTEDCFTIPNLFTPNGDGINDVFQVRGIYKGEWSLEVYNRWGDRVYLNSRYANDWNGDNVEAGVYYYDLKHPTKARKYKGWVQITK
ncbi:MAG: gliding motility-associated C-terminal domain-containing protein [Cytophagales bacterium]|nr:MAG: gliding motility-associated C-terminal domain-containing protein [Cytophagales bacterium]